MADKKHNVVKINDPVSPNHLVRLAPSQEMRVKLSKRLKISEIQIEGHLLRQTGIWSETVGNEKSTIYAISQAADFSSWAKICSAHLGNVIMIPEDKKQSPRVLSVVLDSNERKILTVVNPCNSIDVKVDTNQIIEVVLSNQQIPQWKWNITEGISILRYQVVWAQEVLSDEDYSKHPDELMRKYALFRTTNKKAPETHFWFGLDRMSRLFVNDLDEGVYYGGCLNFFAGNIHRKINIKLRVKGDKKKKGSAIVVPNRSHYVQSSNHVVVRTKEEEQRRTIHLKEKKVSSLDSDCKVIYR